jgi:hypothetical protein
MRETWRAGLVIAFSVLLHGCATGSGHVGSDLAADVSGDQARVGAPTPGVLEFPNRTADDLWRALPAAFSALGIEGGVIDPRARVYGAYQVGTSQVAGKPLRDLFRCGSESSLSGRQYRIRFDITAQPRTLVHGGTELTVRIVGVGTVASPDASGTTQCVSNGTIETQLKQALGGAPGT